MDHPADVQEFDAPPDTQMSGCASETETSDRTGRAGWGGLLIPRLVAQQAACTPDALALQNGSELLTYAEMDQRANQLAHHFTSMGAAPDKVVGLLMERSPSLVVTALAILKAGGAYLPLDPALPAERLHFMLRDAEVGTVVTRSSLASRIESGGWDLVDLDADAGRIASCSATPVDCSPTPENLAYVIYTSGSTGRPKGVEITHRGLANLVAWHRRAFQVTPADRAVFQAALGFDASVWELWPYLAAGASVHIAADAIRSNPEALRDWLVQKKISITFLPTPLAERTILLDWPSGTALRILLTGAETLQQRPPAALPFRLINNYGPTECTVVATSGPVEPAQAASPAPSIGRPIDNTFVYLLDSDMQQVATGSVGELYVGGAGVARGYRNQPALTAEKFVRNPFSADPRDIIYRTGDLARYRPDGELEFLGRRDDQLKIRGYRVEPNEIAAVISAHPAVQASVVVQQEDQTDGKRLVGYVACKPGSVVILTNLREHLLKYLPDYMVPSVFVRMQALPLTPNGKVDRSALPAPNAENALRDQEYTPPRGIVEERLAAIVAPLLNVEKVGMNDNFFLLGGHSLLGTQLLTKISHVFGVDLTLLSLFDHPTLAEISCEIEKLILAKIERGDVPPQHCHGNT